MFGRLLAIARNRDGLSLKEILCYSLSPIPWALGLPDGGLVKTVKSKLLEALESHVSDSICETPSDAAHIFDGMVLLQQLENVKLTTFGDVSEFILKRIMLRSSVVYFVTDQYKTESIKSYERKRR